ncbi:MAG: tetratricopeptide repeat protein [Lentisphaerae bacterium]|nr:tetratricopeptide repeat protein [Lentisphaerota bacterium]
MRIHNDLSYGYSKKTAREKAKLAEALANYGVGFIRESTGDTSAISNYIRAVTLFPDSLFMLDQTVSYLLHIKDTKTAVELVKRYVENHPDSGTAWLRLGYVYVASILDDENQFEKDAEAAFQKAILLNPEVNDTYLGLAFLYIATERKEEAVSLLNDTAKKMDNPVKILRFKADFFFDEYIDDRDNVEALEESLAIYKQLDDYPHDQYSQYYREKMADVAIMAGQPKFASEVYQDLLKHRPHDNKLMLKLLRLAAENDYTELAQEISEKIIALLGTPEGFESVYYQLAESYVDIGKFQDAVRVYTLAVDGYPENMHLLQGIVKLLLEHELSSIEEFFNERFARNPDSLTLKEIYSQTMILLEKYEDAFRQFVELEELFKKVEEPPTLLFYVNYATTASQLGKYEKALELCQKAISLDPHKQRPYQIAFDIYIKQKNEQGAYAILCKTLLHNELSPSVFNFLGESLLKLDRYNEAQFAYQRAETLAKLEENNPLLTNSQFYRLYGTAALKNNDRELAEKLFETGININQSDHEIYHLRAEMWQDTEQKLDDAIDYIKHAIRLEPEKWEYLLTRAKLYFKIQKYELAEEDAKTAFEINPESQEISKLLGDLYYVTEQYQLAHEYWNKTLVLKPENPEVIDKLNELKHKLDEMTEPIDEPSADPNGEQFDPEEDNSIEMPEKQSEPDEEHSDDEDIDCNEILPPSTVEK